jgi:hypothetical protein
MYFNIKINIYYKDDGGREKFRLLNNFILKSASPSFFISSPYAGVCVVTVNFARDEYDNEIPRALRDLSTDSLRTRSRRSSVILMSCILLRARETRKWWIRCTLEAFLRLMIIWRWWHKKFSSKFYYRLVLFCRCVLGICLALASNNNRMSR